MSSIRIVCPTVLRYGIPFVPFCHLLSDRLSYCLSGRLSGSGTLRGSSFLSGSDTLSGSGKVVKNLSPLAQRLVAAWKNDLYIYPRNFYYRCPRNFLGNSLKSELQSCTRHCWYYHQSLFF